MTDLFAPRVEEEKMNENFRKVMNEIAYHPARTIINEVYNSISDIDHDFVSQFQTNFDSKLWELYLAAAFQELEFDIPRTHSIPDFELVKNGQKIFVEAVTSNPSYDQSTTNKLEELEKIDINNLLEYVTNLLKAATIRQATALRKKLIKNYWENDWVAGNPIVIALIPFHHSMVHLLSDSDLMGYLYGVDNTWYHDKDGKLIIDTHEITSHTDGKKTMQSGFFNQPNTENISAVIWSNSGTISKFSRMARLKDIGKDIKIVRRGTQYDHNPDASEPLIFTHIVGETGPKETWREGINMYHNPKAKFPIDRELFPGIAHLYFDYEIYGYIPEFHPINSETMISMVKPEI